MTAPTRLKRAVREEAGNPSQSATKRKRTACPLTRGHSKSRYCSMNSGFRGELTERATASHRAALMKTSRNQSIWTGIWDRKTMPTHTGRTKYPIPEKGQLLRLYTIHKSIKRVAEYFGVSYETTRTWLRFYDIALNPQGKNNKTNRSSSF